MNINNMTRKQFLSLPRRNWNDDIGKFNSFVILPMNTKHDSGYGCMDFVACISMKPIIRLSGCTDDLELSDSASWRIDLLFKSKLLHVRTKGKIISGVAISSLEMKRVSND